MVELVISGGRRSGKTRITVAGVIATQKGVLYHRQDHGEEVPMGLIAVRKEDTLVWSRNAWPVARTYLKNLPQ